MKRLSTASFLCALAVFGAGTLSGASISLDTAGGDPDITSPVFSFATDSGGNFNATFHNVSNPPVDFVTLTLIAPFSSVANYNAQRNSSSCNGGSHFNTCSITFEDNITTLKFDFFGLDASHNGIPFDGFVGVRASSFEPNQTIGANGVVVASINSPEPAGFQLAGLGFGLLGLVYGGKQLLKRRVRL